MLIVWLASILAAYAVGSIPFGVLIARSRGVDIRAHGSRNVGATNVGRVLGKRFGVLCFALDFTKGAASTIGAGLAAGVLGEELAAISPAAMGWWIAVATAAVLGHMHSIFLRFAGGKGVATGFGALIGMWPLLTFPALGALVVWYASLRLFRYVGLASVLAAASLPFWSVVRSIPDVAQDAPASTTLASIAHAWPLHIAMLALAALVTWKHRSNLDRIRRGVEPKVGRPHPAGG